MTILERIIATTNIRCNYVVVFLGFFAGLKCLTVFQDRKYDTRIRSRSTNKVVSRMTHIDTHELHNQSYKMGFK